MSQKINISGLLKYYPSQKLQKQNQKINKNLGKMYLQFPLKRVNSSNI